MNRIQYQLKKRLFRIKALKWKEEIAESQFLTDLKSRVFDSRMNYYAFKDLHKYRSMAIHELKNLNLFISREELKEEQEKIRQGESVDKLIFRLLNFSRAERVVYLGGSLGLSLAYWARVDGNRTIHCYSKDEYWQQLSHTLMKKIEIDNVEFNSLEQLKNLESADFVVISSTCEEECYESFIENINQFLTQECIVVVEDIHRNSDRESLWLKLRDVEQFSVSFDLFSLGVLIAKKELECNDYVLNYRF
jgi:predicted O-methyltransferase YrrM